LDKAKEIYKKYPKIEIEAKELGFFDIDEPERDAYYTAAYVACTSPELKKLHEELRDSIENQHEKDFHAHITVAYLNYGERIDGDIEPMKWGLDNAEMIDTKGQPHKLAFVKKAGLTGWIKPDDVAVFGNHFSIIKKYLSEEKGLSFYNYDGVFDEGWIRVIDSAKYDSPSESMLGFESNKIFDADQLNRVVKFIDSNSESADRKFIRLSKTKEGYSRGELLLSMRDVEKLGLLQAVNKAEKSGKFQALKKVSFGLNDLSNKSLYQSLFASKFKTASKEFEIKFDEFIINASDKEVLNVLEALQSNKIEDVKNMIKEM